MSDLRALRALARLHHIQTAYTDIAGIRRIASPEALLAVLQSLGVPLSRAADAGEALRAERARLAQTGPPVFVVRGPRPSVTLPPTIGGTVNLELIREDGSSSAWTVRTAGSRRGRSIRLPPPVPIGYHRLRVTSTGRSRESLVIAAPPEAFTHPGDRTWGAFLPLYALRTANDWGAGSFSALQALAGWLAALGGTVVATLPLLPVYLDMPYDPSPYAPVSRRFWNEFYIDVERIADLDEAPQAQALIGSPAFQRMLRRERQYPLVRYREQMAVKRDALTLLAGAFFSRPRPQRRAAFDRFVDTHPGATEYAAFRAAGDRIGRPWQQWPPRLRDGTLRPTDYEAAVHHYHLYSQWIAAEQFAEVSGRIRSAGGTVYLDLPLGTHTAGYDTWVDRTVFADGVSCGAPPDTFFRQGQNWGTPPLHPLRLRAQGYRYILECLRHHLAHASLLRIDHVMGLHRFFWIPHGMAAADGVYVRYPADDFYAILGVESVRHRATLVGENLGTVPREVTTAMRRHRVLQTYVVQYALEPTQSAPLAAVPDDSVAAINTHDMPTFAAFWNGDDLTDLAQLGQLASGQAAAEGRRRRIRLRALVAMLRRRRFLRGPTSASAVLRALLQYLGASPARVVLVNLEDLWGERSPQNTPGTADERPNWQRKAAVTWEQMTRMRAVSSTLRRLDRARHGGVS